MAITAICQPGMPPTATVRTTVAGPVTTPGPVAPAGAPGRGTVAVDARAVPGNATAMTPRLASQTPSLLEP